jgi:two-component system chemotaxis response regulator CheB
MTGPGTVRDLVDHRTQAALWTALRTLDEKTGLARRMAGAADARGNRELAGRYTGTAEEAGQAARILRERLTAGGAEVMTDGGGAR